MLQEAITIANISGASEEQALIWEKSIPKVNTNDWKGMKNDGRVERSGISILKIERLKTERKATVQSAACSNSSANLINAQGEVLEKFPTYFEMSVEFLRLVGECACLSCNMVAFIN